MKTKEDIRNTKTVIVLEIFFLNVTLVFAFAGLKALFDDSTPYIRFILQIPLIYAIVNSCRKRVKEYKEVCDDEDNNISS